MLWDGINQNTIEKITDREIESGDLGKLIMFKQTVKDFGISDKGMMKTQFPFPPEVRKYIRVAVESLASNNKMMRGSQAWMIVKFGDWHKSAVAYCCLLSDLIYDPSWHGTLKTAFKARKDADELFAYSTVKDEMDEIRGKFNQDKADVQAAELQRLREETQRKEEAKRLEDDAKKQQEDYKAEDDAKAKQDLAPTEAPKEAPEEVQSLCAKFHEFQRQFHDKDDFQRRIDSTMHCMELFDKQHWIAVARKTLKQLCTVVHLPSAKDGKVKMLQDCDEIGALTGGKSETLGLWATHFDVKLSGESVTNPATRLCALHEQPYQQLVKSIYLARYGDGTDDLGLQDGDIAFLFDGDKGIGNNLTKPWLPPADATIPPSTRVTEDHIGIPEEQPSKHTKRQVFIFKDEESLASRRKLIRGVATLHHQVEHCHVVGTKSTFAAIPEQQGIEYAGTNKSAMLGLVVLDPISNEWRMILKQKKELYGNKRYVVGNHGISDDKALPRIDSSVEPFTLHNMPLKFYKEILWRWHVRFILDMIPSAGNFAMVCIMMRVGCLLIAMAEAHKQSLEDRLLSWLL